MFLSPLILKLLRSQKHSWEPEIFPLITGTPVARGRSVAGDGVMTDEWVMLPQQQLLILLHGEIWGD